MLCIEPIDCAASTQCVVCCYKTNRRRKKNPVLDLHTYTHTRARARVTCHVYLSAPHTLGALSTQTRQDRPTNEAGSAISDVAFAPTATRAATTESRRRPSVSARRCCALLGWSQDHDRQCRQRPIVPLQLVHTLGTTATLDCRFAASKNSRWWACQR